MKEVVQRLFNCGMAYQILLDASRSTLFDDLSKHNRQWQLECIQEGDLEDGFYKVKLESYEHAYDKLNRTRMQLQDLESSMSEAILLIRGDVE